MRAGLAPAGALRVRAILSANCGIGCYELKRYPEALAYLREALTLQETRAAIFISLCRFP